MSADNYIFIDTKKKPIEVWDCVASLINPKSLKDQKTRLIGKTKTVEEALKLAAKEDNDGFYEYGISLRLWAK
jgi:hypothetical protein